MTGARHLQVARLAVGLLGLGVAGCSSSGAPATPGAPSPEPGGPEVPAPSGGHGPAVTYRPVRGALYRLVHHDSLSLQYPGGASQEQVRDRIAFLHLTVAESPSAGTYQVTIALDSIQATESGVPVPPDTTASARGTLWSAMLTANGQLSPLKADRRSTLGDEMAGRLQLLFPRLPAGGVREGMEWTDTTKYDVVADNFPGTETSVISYHATEGPDTGSGDGKALTLETSSSYTRSGTRAQAEQELQMTASGTRKGVHRLGLDGVLVSAEGTDTGEMTISVPALGQTVPVKRSSTYGVSALSSAGR